MTRLGVMADSHRARRNIQKALEQMEDCRLILHLGDHDSDMDAFDLRPGRLISVPGNCDPLSFEPQLQLFERDGRAYGVKYGLTRLALKAREKGARLALFGHSHAQTAEDDGEVLCLNPGALYNGCYAIVTLDAGKITYELKKLDGANEL